LRTQTRTGIAEARTTSRLAAHQALRHVTSAAPFGTFSVHD
jgi:hypothetical protein